MVSVVLRALFAIFFFFFYCYRDHRHLHSFPTRRSSDLSTASRRWSGRTRGCCCAGPSSVWRNSSLAFVRSEEHTSELQSRFDLVCRLLLEKKNNKKKPQEHATSHQPLPNTTTPSYDQLT